jgi:hypothetical protein
VYYRIRIRDISNEKAEFGKSRVGLMRSFGRGLITCVFKGEDLRTGEVGTNLDGPGWGNRSFLFTNKEQHDPFPMKALNTMLNLVWAKDEVHALHKLELIMIPHTGVDLTLASSPSLTWSFFHRSKGYKR